MSARFACLWLLLASLQLFASEGPTNGFVLIVSGASGTPEYAKPFTEAAQAWKKAAEEGKYTTVLLGEGSDSGSTNDLAAIDAFLKKEEVRNAPELWIVLLGHGTDDRLEPKFNLRGPDLSASHLQEALKDFHNLLVFVDGSSASGSFLPKLAATNRVVITATRNGNEQNFARFGIYMSQSIGSPEADLDQDGETSLLESFLMAAQRTTAFYKENGRLATEHPLIEDNGDGLGTPADWFRGIRAVNKSKSGAPVDGFRAHQLHLIKRGADLSMTPEQRAKRDAIEQEIETLKAEKASLASAVYKDKLEALLLKLALLYEESDKAPKP